MSLTGCFLYPLIITFLRLFPSHMAESIFLNFDITWYWYYMYPSTRKYDIMLLSHMFICSLFKEQFSSFLFRFYVLSCNRYAIYISGSFWYDPVAFSSTVNKLWPWETYSLEAIWSVINFLISSKFVTGL